MSTAHAPVRSAVLAMLEALARYHRFTVSGLDSLLQPGAKLIVGYHGRPLAMDLCILTAVLHRHLGYVPHGITHAYFGRNPALRVLIDALGYVPGDGPDLADAVVRGEHVVVAPGGVREGCRSHRHRYTVDWGGRLGYLRLAIRHGLPIVPVATDGIDDVFVGLNDGYTLGKRLGVPHGLPAWLGVGIGVWPFALPLPTRLTMRVGPTITAHLAPGLHDRDALRGFDSQVRGAVQSLLDQGRGVGGSPSGAESATSLRHTPRWSTLPCPPTP